MIYQRGKEEQSGQKIKHDDSDIEELEECVIKILDYQIDDIIGKLEEYKREDVNWDFVPLNHVSKKAVNGDMAGPYKLIFEKEIFRGFALHKYSGIEKHKFSLNGYAGLDIFGVIAKSGKVDAFRAFCEEQFDGYEFFYDSFSNEGAKAFINDLQSSGLNMLHIAVQEGHLPMVEYLVEKGADVNGVSKDGLTALDLVPKDKTEVTKYLKSRGAKSNIETIDCSLKFSYGEVKDNLDMLIKLFEAKKEDREKLAGEYIVDLSTSQLELSDIQKSKLKAEIAWQVSSDQSNNYSDLIARNINQQTLYGQSENEKYENYNLLHIATKWNNLDAIEAIFSMLPEESINTLLNTRVKEDSETPLDIIINQDCKEIFEYLFDKNLLRDFDYPEDALQSGWGISESQDQIKIAGDLHKKIKGSKSERIKIFLQGKGIDVGLESALENGWESASAMGDASDSSASYADDVGSSQSSSRRSSAAYAASECSREASSTDLNRTDSSSNLANNPTVSQDSNALSHKTYQQESEKGLLSRIFSCIMNPDVVSPRRIGNEASDNKLTSAAPSSPSPSPKPESGFSIMSLFRSLLYK